MFSSLVHVSEKHITLNTWFNFDQNSVKSGKFLFILLIFKCKSEKMVFQKNP